MSFFKKNLGNDDKEKLIKEREQLLNEVIPMLREEVRNNPSDGKLHLELVKGLAMGGQLDDAKTESNAAMLKFPISDRESIWAVQAEIDKLISQRDLGY